MKGVIFCEFIGLVDSQFSPKMTERVISKANLLSGGAYTSVGTYDHAEIISLVTTLSEETGRNVSDLVHVFGFFLFGRFAETLPEFFEGRKDAFDFLEHVDSHIHVEVRKLYPKAELPVIECTRQGDDTLIVYYQSGRMMGDLAHGLISACIEFFEESIVVNRQDLDKGPGQHVLFELTRTRNS